MPADIQIALFSATLPPEILQMTKHFMRDPAKILVKNQELTLEGIHQYYVAVEKEEWKIEVLFLNCNNSGHSVLPVYIPKRVLTLLTFKTTKY